MGSLHVNPSLLHACYRHDLAQCLSHAGHACAPTIPALHGGLQGHSLLHVHSTAANSRPCKPCRCRQTQLPCNSSWDHVHCTPDRCAQTLEPRHCCPLQAEIAALQQKLVDGASMLRRAEQDSQALRQQLAELTIQRNKANQVCLSFITSCCAPHLACSACSNAHPMMLEGFI